MSLFKNILSPQKEEKKNSSQGGHRAEASASPLLSPHISSPFYARRKNRAFRIAIITFYYADVLDPMLNSFRTHIDTQAPGQFSYTFFDGQGNMDRLISYATQIIQSYTTQYDAILAIGANAAQTTSRLSLFLNTPIPIIFGNVTNPTHMGVIYPGGRKTENITGIASSNLDTEKQVTVLNSLKKSVTRVLLPYYPGAQNLYGLPMRIARMLNSQGVEVIPVATHNAKELAAGIEQHIQNVDTLMTLRDPLVTNNMEKIIETCNTFGVMVYSSDLQSVESGAAAGFAIKEGDLGVAAAEYVLGLFEHDASPHELPVKTVDSSYVVGINAQALKTQGLELDDQTLQSLKEKIIFDAQKNDS